MQLSNNELASYINKTLTRLSITLIWIYWIVTLLYTFLDIYLGKCLDVETVWFMTFFQQAELGKFQSISQQLNSNLDDMYYLWI